MLCDKDFVGGLKVAPRQWLDEGSVCDCCLGQDSEGDGVGDDRFCKVLHSHHLLKKVHSSDGSPPSIVVFLFFPIYVGLLSFGNLPPLLLVLLLMMMMMQREFICTRTNASQKIISS